MALSLVFFLLTFQDGGSATHVGAQLQLHLPTPYFAEDAFLKNLASGLTTTFEIKVAAKQGAMEQQTGLILEIRYELWDEIYLLKVIRASGQEEHFKIPDLKALKLWLGHHIAFSDLTKLNAKEACMLDVGLNIIPFSEQDKQATLKWVNQGIGSPGARGNVSQPGNRVFTMIMGNSIRRDVLFEYHWHFICVGQP